MKKVLIFLFHCCFGLYSQTTVTLIPTGTNDRLLNISKLANNNIIICGMDGFLSRSTDECNTLTLMPVPWSDNRSISLVRPTADTAYLLATNWGDFNCHVYRSADDCNNWTKVFDSTYYQPIEGIQFFNGSEGVIYSSNRIIRTKTSGSTWISGNSPFVFSSTNNYSAIYGDSLMAMNGISNGGAIVVSKDRGNTWFAGGSFGSLANPTGIFYLNKDTIFSTSIGGVNGPIFLKSYNGGNNWSKTFLGNCSPYNVHFRRANEGYILGMIGGKGVIMKTTDLGQSFSTFNTQIQTQLHDMKFLNDSIALVSGSNGVLFKWNCKASVFVGLKDNLLENLPLKVWPNPVVDILRIEIAESQSVNLQFSISNAFGLVIYPESELMTNQEIEMSNVNSGIYFLKIQSESGQKVFKIVKE